MRSRKLNKSFSNLLKKITTIIIFLTLFDIQNTAQTEAKSTGNKVNQPEYRDEPLNERDKVIHLFANLGPYGQPYLPPELSAASKEFTAIAEQTREGFFFPSIYFLVSAKPNLKPEYKGMRGELRDYEYKNLSQNLEWLKIEIIAKVRNCDGKIIDGNENSIRILGLLPDETLARTEDSQTAQAVEKTGKLADAVVPFVPGTSSIVKNGTSLANVLFQNILSPPQLTAYRYSFINSQTSFGWYWKADNKGKLGSSLNSTTVNTSLLGLRRGVILLQVPKGIKSVSFEYTVVAKWSRDVDKYIDDEYYDPKNVTDEIVFTSSGSCEKTNNQDFFTSQNYRFLKDLNGFPMLIPEDVVCDIFQASKEKCIDLINTLLTEHKEINYFTVERPKIVEKDENGQSVLRIEGTEKIRLLRRTDLQAVLMDRK